MVSQDRIAPQQIDDFLQLSRMKVQEIKKSPKTVVDAVPSIFSKKQLAQVRDNFHVFHFRAEEHIAANNQLVSKEKDRAVRFLTCGKKSLQERPIDIVTTMEKLQLVSAYDMVKRCLQRRLRRNLQRSATTYEERKVDQLMSKFTNTPSREYRRWFSMGLKYPWGSTETLSILGRVQEIKNMYKDTHYVFTHGQSVPLSIVNMTIRELIRNFHPKFFHPLAPTFRMPGTVPFTPNIDAFARRYPVDSVTFRDNAVNLELLSVDPYFWNTDSYESAIDFFTGNKNICTLQAKDKIRDLLMGLLSAHLPNRFACNLVAEKLNTIVSSLRRETQVGILHAICVPKVIVKNPEKNLAYRAHPMGIRCPCHPGKHIKVLDDLQNDKVTKCSVPISGLFGTWNIKFNPQYRLLTSSMMQNKDGSRTLGVRSFAIDGMKKSARENYQRRVRNTIEAFSLYSEFFHFQKQLSRPQQEALLAKVQKPFQENTELDRALIVPLIRRRAREKIFSQEVRDQMFSYLGVQDIGDKRDEGWIDESPFRVAMSDLWSTVSGIWSKVSSIFGSLFT